MARRRALAGILAIALPAIAMPEVAVAQAWLERPVHARLMAVIAEDDSALAPFTTDGCSGGMSSAWEVVAETIPAFGDLHGVAPPWESCCITHDRAYHNAGGASDADSSYAARLEADETLRTCVVEVAEAQTDDLATLYGVGPEVVLRGYAAVGTAMFRAVRLGGGPCSGLPWRWGYGWPDC